MPPAPPTKKKKTTLFTEIKYSKSQTRFFSTLAPEMEEHVKEANKKIRFAM